MVILRTGNKITDFLMILAWASPFKAKKHISRIAKTAFIADYFFLAAILEICKLAN